MLFVPPPQKGGKVYCLSLLKGTRGVQHGVWTHLHSFFIIRESIDITINKDLHYVVRISFGTPVGGLKID